MRSTWLATILTTALLQAVHGQEATKAPFSLETSPETQTVTTGSRVWVKVRMTNNSSHEINCEAVGVNGVNLRYSYDVRDQSGTEVKKKVHQNPYWAQGGSVMFCTLAPGQSTPAADNLISELFDMSQPGKYAVQVSRAGSDKPGDGTVKSNIVTVTITP